MTREVDVAAKRNSTSDLFFVVFFLFLRINFIRTFVTETKQ